MRASGAAPAQQGAAAGAAAARHPQGLALGGAARGAAGQFVEVRDRRRPGPAAGAGAGRRHRRRRTASPAQEPVRQLGPPPRTTTAPSLHPRPAARHPQTRNGKFYHHFALIFNIG